MANPFYRSPQGTGFGGMLNQFNQLYNQATNIYNSGIIQNVKAGGNPFAGLFHK